MQHEVLCLSHRVHREAPTKEVSLANYNLFFKQQVDLGFSTWKNITYRRQQGCWGQSQKNHTGLHWGWWHQDTSCRGPWDQLWVTHLWSVWPHSKWQGILDYRRWTGCVIQEKLETLGSIRVEECWKPSESLRLGGRAPATTSLCLDW